MKRFLPYLKNKYILTSLLFLVYWLILDEYDIFTMMRNRKNLKELDLSTSIIQKKLDETREIAEKLKYQSEIERFAREEKLFKKDNEDVFVIFYE